ncbi:F0F1 ATP synthase subunit epsilon [Anaeromyxobacter paludicola]|uniref:ATP synthase epsilon chain n=1 Tax=Anaeromyxobacter paludicola TaxID=2918171 RepID=A0ABN6NCL1_9BACT|nr:F0F1 ATP synthase subunit epsilon [Anaeromyxobacter paludicola]BDG09703.1 ATP synthase epsilon chain [Anaeromyxobacter paludicola]
MAITLDIVTPEKRVLSVSCDEVRAPGVQGGFGIRQDHTPFMSALEPGRLTYVEGGREHHYAIGGGFLQVADNKVIVLADTAEARDEIDVARAQAALEEANERLRSMTEQDQNHGVESARVRRAAARLSVAR